MAVVRNDCRQRVVLTTGNPKSVASVYVSVVKFRSQWVRLVSQNCPVCLSLIDDRLCLYFLAFSPPTQLASLVESVSVLFGCIPPQQIIPKVETLLTVAV